MQNQVKDYINARYERYLDYSTYKCCHAGLVGEEIDVLNTVLIDVMAKDEEYIKQLYDKKKEPYRELDFFILKLIATYATSDTAPYRFKYRNRLPIDANKSDLSRLDLIDEKNNDIDRSGRIVFEMDITRWIFERLALDDLEVCVFNWKFFEGEPLTDWPIANEMKNLYSAYNIVERTIYEILKSQGLTRAKPKDKKYDVKRVQLLVRIFEKCHLKAFLKEIQKLKYILEETDV